MLHVHPCEVHKRQILLLPSRVGADWREDSPEDARVSWEQGGSRSACQKGRAENSGTEAKLQERGRDHTRQAHCNQKKEAGFSSNFTRSGEKIPRGLGSFLDLPLYIHRGKHAFLEGNRPVPFRRYSRGKQAIRGLHGCKGSQGGG